MEKADLNYNESPIERKIARKKYKGSKIFLNNQKNIHNDRKQVFLVEDFAESKITLQEFLIILLRLLETTVTISKTDAMWRVGCYLLEGSLVILLLSPFLN